MDLGTLDAAQHAQIHQHLEETFRIAACILRGKPRRDDLGTDRHVRLISLKVSLIWPVQGGCAILRETPGMVNMTQDLARKLRATGMGGILAVLLEAAGPLTVIGAQAAYLADPLFGGLDLVELGRVLEDPQQVSELVDELRAQSERHSD
jgi:hypothetical protein